MGNTISSLFKSQAATDIQRLFRGFAVRKAENNRGTCGICLEDDRRINLRALCPLREDGSGGHLFHMRCARDYFSTVQAPMCPSCRTNLSGIDAAQPALSALGTRYSNYVEPVMTADEAHNSYQILIRNLPSNPTEAQRQDIIESYNTWQLLCQNEVSIA